MNPVEENVIPNSISINVPYAIVWEVRSKLHWFIGFPLHVEGNSCSIDYLHRVKKSNINWYYPAVQDLEITDDDQFLPVDIIGEWDYSNEDQYIFILKNEDEIISCFEEYVK